MRSGSVVGRIAAIGAVVLAIAIVAVLLFRGGGGYTVTAQFLNAAQLVKGNQVMIGGTAGGSVKDIKITDDGQAQVKLSVKEDYDDLPAETQAVIRQASQSGIANRYVELQLPSNEKRSGKKIADGGRIPISRTTTTVELDELFNTLDAGHARGGLGLLPQLREAVQGQGRSSSARSSSYLNPALSTSSRLFNELNRDSPLLVDFLQDSEKLVTALAEKRDDLSALVGNAQPHLPRAQQRARRPRRGHRPPPRLHAHPNTTFVNLRSALDDVDPLVDASKPVARQLQPFLRELRPLARDAKPDHPRPQQHPPPARCGQRPPEPPEHAAGARRGRARHQGARGRTSARARSASARCAARSRRPSRRSATPRRSSATAARTRRTCSAGSTTSRPPAVTTPWAASRARRSSSTRSEPHAGRPRADRHRRPRPGVRRHSRSSGSTGAARAAPRSPPLTARTSSARRSSRPLDCRDADRATGPYTP